MISPKIVGNSLTKFDDHYWQLAFFLTLLSYIALVMYTSFNYRPDSRLFPVLVGSILVFLIIVKIGTILAPNEVLSNIGGVMSGTEADSLSSDDDESLNRGTRYQRELEMIGWTGLLLLLLWLLGFVVSTVVFVSGFIYWYEREIRKVVLPLLVSLAIVYGLFIELLGVSLWRGILLNV